MLVFGSLLLLWAEPMRRMQLFSTLPGEGWLVLTVDICAATFWFNFVIAATVLI